MVTLRDRKRAASQVDTQADPPKKTRKAKTKAEPISDDDEDDDQKDTSAAPPKKPTKSKGKGKAIKADPENSNDEANPNDAPNKAKGKAAIKAEPDAADDKGSSAQFAKAKNLLIPVDDLCTLGPAYHVYVDSNDGIIYDAALNQTNTGKNANKFYKIQLLTDGGSQFFTWTRWGRVGEAGQNALLGSGSLADAFKHFNKKFKEKSGLSWDDRSLQPKAGKYVFVERSYEADSDEDDHEHEEDRPNKSDRNGHRSRSSSPTKCSLEPPVKELMELIFNQKYIEYTMADLNYDAEKLPLGKLSKTTITRGYESLKSLAALLNDASLAQSEYQTSFGTAVENLSNNYYSYIPHAFGRNRPPVIDNQEAIKREVTLLESLTDLKDSDSILKSLKNNQGVHPLDQRYQGLGMQEMMPVDHNTQEFDNISEYLKKTSATTHGITYDIRDIFRIERSGEAERFKKYAKVNSDRRLLWHGSRSTNYGGILSQGLRIAPPEAPVSGYMFGKGVYLSDMSSKSANYCCHSISGGHALLLLCEAELGDPMQELTNASYAAGDDAIAKGLYSTWGKGRTGPVGWKAADCIHPSLAGVKMPDTTKPPGDTKVNGASLLYNEFICYDVAQIRLRYLLRVKM